ncbi:MAG: nucleoside kinase [Lachnospiraceae bacterium]|nr:nucleoside kinase [Lachnospiraceae bacterium]
MGAEYQVTIGDTTKAYPAGTAYGEIVKEFQPQEKSSIILVVANGKLRELHKTLKQDVTLSFVTTSDDIGHKTYKRGCSLLFLKAVYHVAGHENVEKVILHFSVSSGFYYTIQGNVVMDEDFLVRVKAYMLEMVGQAIPIMKRSVSTAEARELFHKYGMYDKEKLFRFRRVSKVNIYKLEEFEDYYYGFMPCDTSYMKYFDLYLYEEGVVLQMPNIREPEVVPPFEPLANLFKVQQESVQWAEQMDISTVGDLNEEITRQNTRQMILIAEALQEGKVSSIAHMVADRPHVKFVMIAGPSSSGKTTFSQRLSIQLWAHGLHPHYIGIDNYFVNREDTPLDEDGNRNYECLGAIDVEQFNKDMTELLDGKRVELPEFNFRTGQREYKGNYMQLGEGDILVIEGIHGLNDQLSYSLPRDSKFKIYISALTQLNIDEHNRIPTTDGRLIRRMVRDARTRGTSAKDTIAMWPSVRRGEGENIFPFQESADVMFNSALIYELAVLKQYAEPVLFQIQRDDPEYQEAKRLLKFLDYFVGIPVEDVPRNSILREFIGGGCFNM